jgi:hypothetical protein
VGIELPRRQDVLTTIDQARWTTTVYIGAYFEWVSASVTRTYYYAGNTRVAERVGGTVYYLFGDHPSTALRTGSRLNQRQLPQRRRSDRPAVV